MEYESEKPSLFVSPVYLYVQLSDYDRTQHNVHILHHICCTRELND